MHALVDQLLSLSEELACQDHHRGGAVPYFVVLHSADICTAPGVRAVDAAGKAVRALQLHGAPA